MGTDRVSASYLVERVEPVGRSISGGYRFGKVAIAEATTLATETEANKVLKCMKRQDSDAEYTVVSL